MLKVARAASVYSKSCLKVSSDFLFPQQNLDLTKHKLIYEGPLTWRIAKGQKNIDLHVLLLDEFIVLLQKADDKYILKNHSINKSLGKDDNKLTHSPIIKYGPSMLFRAVATGKAVIRFDLLRKCEIPWNISFSQKNV